ncbi:uncharacterized protein SPPG_08840 [Spizellomyces punctatus DAOM BR117]|uniref:Acyl-coenzyme A thioesterase 13 n=1 Tax=Spizellomyces punctatus (strain DAOM BR117) TaxID=645134 RepID=A0A0L0HUZ7_SPIPD|nr:uncharacterized protein SPPG_08840 [Spizellomyces punctatus DAOM BR117]KND04689.1 hypothetical protein SPPG_08840 [Spizellomyces punctatus DAOM BR117]|eukprot:XP_016612728.1 hypothetical protein SPPG_08840 [Spizellomyces punctatus DAOM BR117]
MPESDVELVGRIQDVISTLSSGDSERYGTETIRKLKVVQARPGQLVFEVTVTKDLLNHFGALHGAAIALMVDFCTSLALISAGKDAGASVDLSTQYLSSAREGDVVLVSADIVKTGGTLAFTKTVICAKDSGKIIASGTHMKFIKASKL